MENKLIVKCINKSKHQLPTYAKDGDAGMDLRADLSSYGLVTLRPMQRVIIPTGLYIQLPRGYEAQIRPRSGLAIKNGITVLNTPATIDPMYTGEIKVILVNLGELPFTVYDGDRIAQMVIKKFETVEFEVVDQLEETERGEGGFGHSGIK